MRDGPAAADGELPVTAAGVSHTPLMQSRAGRGAALWRRRGASGYCGGDTAAARGDSGDGPDGAACPSLVRGQFNAVSSATDKLPGV